QERQTETIEGIRMTLIHTGNAHTSGDLAVYLPGEKIVFTGDLVGNGNPTIHLNKGGNSEGWAKFVSALVALDADTYVTGHSPVKTKAQVETTLKTAEDARAKIAALVKEGKSLDEVKQAFGETAPNAGAPQFYTRTIYEELTKK